ncbi:META domain-containing protein [Aestuariivirga sp.]|jgi:heat shock protein HslJ|uniref:META domain-containing protein n=1 Tax=Aestuariivirga sp. TaxID=2650926 RepID=UPI003782EB04
MIRFAAAVVLLVVSLSVPALANGTDAFRAQGNEPFWSLSMGEGELTFRPMDGEAVTLKPVPQPRVDGQSNIYDGGQGDGALTVTIAAKLCTDSMTGMPFPRTVMVVRGGKTFSGCGGEPVSLLRGEWQVTEIAGRPVIAEAVPTVTFGGDGKISGLASCNRFFGGYSLTGEGLAVGQLGSTKMLCEPVVMDQEQVVLSLLETAGGFALDEQGQLTLRSGDGRTLTARPLRQ